jgi:hypothetical protein
MPQYAVVNLVTVTMTNMIDELPSGYGALRTTDARIWHQVFHTPAQRSHLLSKSPADQPKGFHVAKI